jgi:dihydrofolate reductase
MKDDAGFADKMNSMPKYVVSTTLTDPAWNNTTVLPDVDAVAGLKQREGDILVAGSAQLHQGLVERGLVDEWRLMVFPIVLGSGKRLFGDAADATGLELVDSRQLASGSLYLTYRRAAA